MSKPRNIKQQVIDLRQQGLSYPEIQNILKCSKGTLSYHLNSATKQKSRISNKKFKKLNPLKVKLDTFNVAKSRQGFIHGIKKNKLEKLLYSRLTHFTKLRSTMSQKITINDLLDKYKDGFFCYLTGETINIENTNSYEFDHIIPSSRGGDNSLNNLGICTKEVNQAKKDKTPEEFFELCKKVLEYNGYSITKVSGTGIAPA